MLDLGATYKAFLDAQGVYPEDAQYIPEDGVCKDCGRLVRGHSGVELVLALRKIKYWDSEKGEVVIQGGIPYCTCKQPRAATESSQDPGEGDVGLV